MIGRDGFFSADLDLNLVPTLDAAAQTDMIMGINRMVAAWYGFERPVVGAINGHAIAGGIVLALCADYRVGSTKGKLGLTETARRRPLSGERARRVVQAELSPPAARYAGPAGAPRRAAGGARPRPGRRTGRTGRRARAGACDGGRAGRMPSDGYATVKRQLRGPALAEMRRVVESGTDPLAQSWLSAETGSAATAALADEG